MKTKYLITLLSLLVLPSTLAFAQGAEPVTTTYAPHALLQAIIYVVAGMMLLVTLLLWKMSGHLKKFLKGDLQTEEEKMWDNRTTWEKVFQLKPMGTDKDMQMDHSYDGIQELDNPAPPWFMFLFYASVAFGVVYFVRFSILHTGPTQAEEYAAEMQVAEEQIAAKLGDLAMQVDETNVTFLEDQSDLGKGLKIYETNCKVCHSDGGKGSTGPNLTDPYWKHGGGIVNVFRTIKYGVPEKGMISWQNNLNPLQMQQVASYILSLQGTNPEGGKEPEGELWVPEETPTDSTTQEVVITGSTEVVTPDTTEM